MQPFQVFFTDAALDDLRSRVAATRWPGEVRGAEWRYGAPLAYMRELARHWVEAFDWRRHEARLNALPQFRTVIDGLEVHFVYVKGRGPDSLPLVLTHGWPSSFIELADLVPALTDPASVGGDARDAFDVVIPSLPGFGFSSAPPAGGNVAVDRLWRVLMTERLGYERFYAHGTDVGARVTSAIGRNHADVVGGIHLGSVDLDWPDPMPADGEMTAEERAYVAGCDEWDREFGAYAAVQSTTPQTAAYALNDSPVGLAAWIVEKFHLWSDREHGFEGFDADTLLANVTLYWLTGTIGSSMRRYFEVRHQVDAPRKAAVAVPTGVAMFPGESLLVVPRSWAERAYNLVHWTEMPRGGHFPALEEPGLLLEDLRAYFRRFR